MLLKKGPWNKDVATPEPEPTPGGAAPKSQPVIPAPSTPSVPAASATSQAPVITRPINANGLRLVKSFEGCSLTAYLDDSTPPVATIGWGEIFHNDGSPVQMGETITQAEADAMLLHALTAESGHFIDAWTTATLTDNQYSALVSFVYNAGCGTYRRKVLPLINANNFSGALAAMSACNSAGGGPLPGLVRRRKAEVALFQGNIDAMNEAINA